MKTYLVCGGYERVNTEEVAKTLKENYHLSNDAIVMTGRSSDYLIAGVNMAQVLCAELALSSNMPKLSEATDDASFLELAKELGIPSTREASLVVIAPAATIFNATDLQSMPIPGGVYEPVHHVETKAL